MWDEITYMYEYFQPTLHNGYNYIPMLGLKLINDNERASEGILGKFDQYSETCL